MNALLAGIVIAIAGLAGVERLAVRHGARRWPADRRRAVLSTLALLLAVGWVAPALGLRYGSALVPRLLAGALFLLLVIYLWQLLPRLRPLLGARVPARPSSVFVLLPFVVYLAILPWATAERPPDGDEPYYLLVTHSLVHDFDVDLANNYEAEDSRRFLERALEPQKGDPVGPQGEVYSRHNALLPAVLAPAYLAAGKHGALAVMCLIAALLCWWTLRVARHWFADEPGAVLAAYFVMAFTSPLLLYSHQVWVEVPAALLLSVALDAGWSLGRNGPNPRRQWLYLLLPLLVLPLLKIRFFLIALPLLAVVAFRLGRRSRRWALAAIAGFVLLAAGILLFNQMQYGNPLKYHNISKLSFYWTELERYPRGLNGLFFDVAFGLFASAPIWLLLVVARPRLGLLVQSLVIAGPYLLLLIPRSEWYGAWSPPFRYGCFALTLLTLFLVPAFRDRRRGGARLVIGALAGSTALLSALWVMRPGWTYNFAHGRTHLLDIISTGQGIDVARFFPSALRPNAALWIWPPLLIATLWLLWRWRIRTLGSWWLGASLPLVAAASVLVLAHRLPTTTIEAEDPYVIADGGELFPGLWVTGRTRYHGGWRLSPGVSLEVPLIPGGRRCSVAVELRRVGRRPARTYLKIGPKDSKLATAKIPRETRWTTLEIDELVWPEGADRLVVWVKMPKRAPDNAALLVDRIKIRWSDPEPDGPISD